MLEGIITSRATRKILGILYSNPDGRFYIRQLERFTGLHVNTVKRELEKMEKAGFLHSKREERIKLYWVNKENPIYGELRSIVLKTEAVGDNLRKLMEKVSDVRIAFIYGSVAKGEETASSDIDLLMIGDVDGVRLHREIDKIENEIKRTVNYSLLSAGEIKKKKTDFLNRVLKEKKIFLIGDENELRKLTETK